MSADSALQLRIRQILNVAKKNMKIYYMEPPILIFGIFFPFFIFLAFALGKGIPFSRLVPGLMGITFFFTGSSVGPFITPWETRTKTLERLLTSPASAAVLILGDIFSGVVFGIGVSAIVLAVGMFGLGASVAAPAVLAATILLSAVCFGALGSIFSALPTDKPSNVMMLSNLVRLPLIFISGVFVPLTELPAWGRGIAFISPVTYVTDLMRYAFGQAHAISLSVDFLALGGFCLLFLYWAITLHQKTMPRRI